MLPAYSGAGAGIWARLIALLKWEAAVLTGLETKQEAGFLIANPALLGCCLMLLSIRVHQRRVQGNSQPSGPLCAARLEPDSPADSDT